jgi:hypothetical protein
MNAAATTAVNHLARYATAVVPRENFSILHEGFPEDEQPYWFDIYLNEGADLNFHVADDDGDYGAIFYFDDIRIPQPVDDVPDLQVGIEPPFSGYWIMDPPGHHTLIVLYVDEDTPNINIRADGHDSLLLAHVEWRL